MARDPVEVALALSAMLYDVNKDGPTVARGWIIDEKEGVAAALELGLPLFAIG